MVLGESMDHHLPIPSGQVKIRVPEAVSLDQGIESVMHYNMQFRGGSVDVSSVLVISVEASVGATVRTELIEQLFGPVRVQIS